MKTLTRVVLPLLAIAAGALAGMWLARDSAGVPPPLQNATMYPAPRPLPAFDLVDQHGRPFGPERLAGQWTLMFFGYLHCPDICPATLATLATARRELAGLPPALQPQVVLVSVDPGRDTVDKLAGYIGFFDPAFVGVTGAPEQAKRLADGVGVVALPGPPDEYGNYSVDHSTAVFLVDPAGAIAAVFRAPHSPDGLANDYRVIVDRIGGGAA